MAEDTTTEPIPARGPGRTVLVRKWTDADRANALAVLASCGGNIEKASRETGIPASTLRIWRDRPASGSLRANLAVREELLAQSLERLLWRLGRAAKGKVQDAKLSAVLSGFALVFDRWKTLRDRTASGAANAGATGGLDLSALTSDELRSLAGLLSKASGRALDPGADPNLTAVGDGGDGTSGSGPEMRADDGSLIVVVDAGAVVDGGDVCEDGSPAGRDSQP